jgi:hypothetical protein
MDYRITIEVKNVADGDVETIAQEVWDKYAEDYDANRGERTTVTSTRAGRLRRASRDRADQGE